MKKKIKLKQTHPQLVLEWDYEKNTDITPEKVTYGSEKKVWWKCENGHEFISSIYSRYKAKNLCYMCYKEKLT